ncbi:MAG TPA: patatin-like phospholipase family protein [Gaiellaceae bacterium]
MAAPAAQERLGLCLSGGGFRASFYALGALRYLAEADQLERVDVVSAVSGGSIAAAALADKWTRFVAAGGSDEAFLREIDAPFRNRVTSTNLRNSWIRRSAIPFSGGRGRALGRTLEKFLYDADRVVELPSHPQVIFTSTDLVIGRAFRIARDFMGSWDYKYADVPDSLGLGLAVASSAAFPMSLTVVSLPTAGLGLTGAPDPLPLHDGGVYDNLGLEWFQGWASGRPAKALNPGFKIVANASGLLSKTRQKYGAARSLLRDLSVQYAQTLNLRVRWFVDHLLAPGPTGAPRERGVYIGIGRDPRTYVDAHGKPIDPSYYAGALPSAFVEPLALLRTDLDRFLPEEADLLSYHAYWSLHARLKTFAPSLAVPTDPQWTTYANLSADEQRRLLAILEKGAKRKLWRRKKHKLWRWTI